MCSLLKLLMPAGWSMYAFMTCKCASIFCFLLKPQGSSYCVSRGVQGCKYASMLNTCIPHAIYMYTLTHVCVHVHICVFSTSVGKLAGTCFHLWHDTRICTYKWGLTAHLKTECIFKQSHMQPKKAYHDMLTIQTLFS